MRAIILGILLVGLVAPVEAGPKKLRRQQCRAVFRDCLVAPTTTSTITTTTTTTTLPAVPMRTASGVIKSSGFSGVEEQAAVTFTVGPGRTIRYRIAAQGPGFDFCFGLDLDIRQGATQFAVYDQHRDDGGPLCVPNMQPGVVVEGVIDELTPDTLDFAESFTLTFDFTYCPPDFPASTCSIQVP